MSTANTSAGAKTPAQRTSAARKSAAQKATATPAQDAIAMLKADHRAVGKLFGQFEKAGDEGRKAQIARRIIMELQVHMRIEEEIFYPTSREFLTDDAIVDEAVVEHQAAKDLMEQIDGMDASDELYDAKVTVLREQIEHHVAEEETEYFPKVQKTEMDTRAIGARMKARKDELMAQMDGGAAATH